MELDSQDVFRIELEKLHRLAGLIIGHADTGTITDPGPVMPTQPAESWPHDRAADLIASWKLNGHTPA